MDRKAEKGQEALWENKMSLGRDERPKKGEEMNLKKGQILLKWGNMPKEGEK